MTDYRDDDLAELSAVLAEVDAEIAAEQAAAAAQYSPKQLAAIRELRRRRGGRGAGPAAPYAPAPPALGVPTPLDRQGASQSLARMRVLADLIGPEPVPTDARCWRCRAPSGVPCNWRDGARPYAHGDRARAVARWERLRAEAAAALDVLVDPGVTVGDVIAVAAAEHRAPDRVRRLRRCALQAGAPLRWSLPSRWEALAALDAAGVRDARR